MKSIAPRTLQSYRSALSSYLSFCHTHCCSSPFPLVETTLARFAAHLADSGLLYGTIRVYLSGLRFMQVARGLPDPSSFSWCYLERVLKGIRRSSPAYNRPARLPITPPILYRLFQVWSHPPVSWEAVMLWAACCTGFFGFLRSGEFTCPCSSTSNEDVLSVEDVYVDSHSNPLVVTVHLRRSKTDTFGVGTMVYLGRVDGPICPVKALLGYLAMRGQIPGPLFLFHDGTPLTRSYLVEAVRCALQAYGMDVRGFNGHSFRIGVATTAAACGLPDSLIQTLGRWRSSAFTAYIRTPVSTLAGISSRLMAPPPVSTRVAQ